MSKATDTAHRALTIYRNYPAHVASRQQSIYLKELAEHVIRLQADVDKMMPLVVAKATDELDANGRLLAAAPEMLSALMECMAWFVSNEVTCIARDDAKAAIEKATGEVV